MASRRPPDRKSQIRAAATALFGQRGYHNVSVADVADSLGITDAALYYHFRGKQDLLFHAVLDGLDTVDALIREAASLDDALRSLVRLVAGPRRLLAVCQREARHLRDPERETIRAREAHVAAGLVPLLRTARRELGAADAELIAWAVLGALGSRARQPPGLSQPGEERLLYRMGSATAYSRLPAAGPPPVPVTARAQQVRSCTSAGTETGLRRPRRDQLLTEAVALFDERGFQSVSIADIGAAAGIVASGLYRYYPSKTDLLVAAANQGAERMRAGADQAMSAAGNAREAVKLLLRAHIAVAIEHRHLVGILTHERAQLPADERASLRRREAEYLGVWVRALAAVLPEREPAELTMVIEATHSMIYFVVRSGRSGLRPGLPGRLTEIGMTLLLSG